VRITAPAAFARIMIAIPLQAFAIFYLR